MMEAISLASRNPQSSLRARTLAFCAALLAALGCSQPSSPSPEPVEEWTTVGPLCGDGREFYYRPPDDAGMKDFALAHDGQSFHLFAMRASAGWLAGGAKTFVHARSSDLVDWTDHTVLDLRRSGVAEDNIWAPHVIHHADRWWMFYTGVTYDEGAEAHNVQRIVSAVSDDLTAWTPTPMVIEGDPSFTQWGSGEAWGNDLRDGMLWRDGTDWIMLATVRLLDGRQCIARARSTDLLHWSWERPLLFTAGVVAESPTMVRYRDRLWLFWTSASRILAASAVSLDEPFTREEFELVGFANETLALSDGSVLMPRVRAHAVAFVRMLPDAVRPPSFSTRISPLCFEGDLLLPDPTVRLRLAANGIQNIHMPEIHRSRSAMPEGRNNPSLVRSPAKNEPSWMDSMRSDRR